MLSDIGIDEPRPVKQGSDPPTERISDAAYTQLYEAIITLEIAPGTLLNSRELSQKAGVARPTIAQAIQRLASVGLVSVLPRRGVLVSPVNLTDVQQVFDARQSLEGSIVVLAAKRATPMQLNSLRALSDSANKVADTVQDPSRFVEMDRDLHMALARLARNRFLEDAITRVWDVNRRLWHLFFSELGWNSRYFLSHDLIIDGIQNGDEDLARKAMYEHLANSKELLQHGLWGK